MKKLILLIFMGLLLAGCGTAVERSEFWKHSSHYANWDHTLFSWFEYKKPTKKTLEESQRQDWWGIPVQTPK
jgi:uncharacterized protein YceK